VTIALVGELARPLTIVMLGLSGAVSGVIIAMKVSDGNDGGIFIGAFGALIGGIYFGKAWEIVKTQTARPEPPSIPPR
jgi:hypothetical protein